MDNMTAATKNAIADWQKLVYCCATYRSAYKYFKIVHQHPQFKKLDSPIMYCWADDLEFDTQTSQRKARKLDRIDPDLDEATQLEIDAKHQRHYEIEIQDYPDI